MNNLTEAPTKSISGKLRFVIDTEGQKAEVLVFIAAFTARSRKEGWNVDDIEAEIEVRS